MAGTKKGGKKAASTNKKRWGKGFYAMIGAMGGKAEVPKGFALMSPEKRSTAGRKGGMISSRAGVKNGEGKTERKDSMPVYNRQRKVYVCHKKAKMEKVEVKHG